MEKSAYNFIIKGKEYNLIYNSFTNILLEVDENIIKYLETYTLNDRNLKPNGILPGEYDTLFNCGVLCIKKEDQKHKILRDIHTGIQYRIGSNRIILEIHPNSDCNFDCYYCYVRKESKERHITIKNQILQSIYKYLETRLKAGYKNISIGWCGGEPLLVDNLITQSQIKISKLIAQYNATLQASLVTNGVLLTPLVSKQLVEAGINMAQITIDGTEIIHNKRRRRIDLPKQNYYTIINNIINSDERLKIQIRVNIDRMNIENIYDLLDDLIQMRVWPYKSNVSKRIDIGTVNDGAYYKNKHKISPVQLSNTRQQFRKRQYEKFLEITKNTKAKLDFQFPIGDDVCSNIGYPSGWVIDVDGNLFKCSEHIGNQKIYITHINEIADNIEKELEMFKAIQPYTEKNLKKWGCMDCKVLPVCRKRCAWEYQNINGINRRCSEAKYNLKTDIKLQYNLFKKNPTWFNEISNLRIVKKECLAGICENINSKI